MPPNNTLSSTNTPQAFSIDALVSPRRCGSTCNCQCHVRSHIRSPTWLRRIVGCLFVSYSGIPYLPGQACNLRACNRGKLALRVSYMFPTALISKIFSITTAWTDLLGIQMTLRAPTVINTSSGIWNIVEMDKPLNLRMAFDGGYAYPTDVDVTGETLLHVRA